MANKIIKRKDISHCYESNYPYSPMPSALIKTEVDKSKTISELSTDELRKMLDRLRNEREVQDIIRSLRRSSGEKDTYENPAIIDTNTPINQLYHHGILGMKWGVRRFQKEDGTRTPAGKKRDALAKSKDHTDSREKRSRATKGLSTSELRELNDRLQLEVNYQILSDKLEKGESFVQKAIKDAGKSALTEFAKGAFLGSAKLIVKKLSPSFAEAAFNIKGDNK